MARYEKTFKEGTAIYVGIDLHKKAWHVTILSEAGAEWSGGIPGKWEALRDILDRYQGCRIHAAYEAGCFGFWLHDRLVEYKATCIVTPPSLLPVEYGNKVKTDRRDSLKLARFLQKDLLKKVYVPTEEELSYRQVFRRRRQMVEDRVRTQHRILSELRIFGLEILDTHGPFSRAYIRNLRSLRFRDRYLQHSFNHLVDEYEFLGHLIDAQTSLIHELAETERYRDHVAILTSIPGVGVLTAMEILVELIDMNRFRNPEQLAAYIGLTPSQHSSGDTVRMGHITGIGKSHLRATLIEAAWRLIRKDGRFSIEYTALKRRIGGKRAIVAIARKLIIRIRYMLLNQTPYTDLAA